MRYIFTIFILVILLLLLPSNFIVLRVKSSRWYTVSILNVILFSILFTDILIGGLSVVFSWYTQNSLEYYTQNTIHQVIKTFHFVLELILWIYCFYMIFLCFSMCSTYQDLIKEHTYHFSWSLFYLQDWVIVYKSQNILLFL